MARITLVLALALAVGGCAGDGDYENAPRPPAPINVSAAIDGERIRVSPRRFGAGPVVFVISNRSGGPRRLTFETDELGGDAGGVTRSTPEIAHGGTGTLEVDPRAGRYRLSAGPGVEAAAIEVGDRRASAQDELLLP